MPLDTHSYLVKQGWSGSGTGLRQGAIVRPLAIPQKKTLAGLGKDRDEAFPFWDHLFSAASKSIQIKISSDDSDESESESNPIAPLNRTSTGILSNRRPATGTLADTSGATTPDLEANVSQFSLLVFAKREAARRGLYSRFFRGPVLGPVETRDEERVVVAPSDIAEEPVKKRRKVGDGDGEAKEDKEARRERRRIKKAVKELKRQEKEAKRARKKAAAGKDSGDEAKTEKQERGRSKGDSNLTAEENPKQRKRKRNAEAISEKSSSTGEGKRRKCEEMISALANADVDTANTNDKKRKRKAEDMEADEDKARRKEERRRRKAASKDPDTLQT
ncbi:hypothetical protein C8F01DRAFT_1113613 [Mycena amicta]|nr:hypothetical protein C8F01DRAFT_1113613 [Mycena amicta]